MFSFVSDYTNYPHTIFGIILEVLAGYKPQLIVC
jgi:hypothetical protein